MADTSRHDGGELKPDEASVPFFGARARVRELSARVDELTTELTGIRAERDQLRADQERLGVLGAAELERRTTQLRQDADQQTRAIDAARIEAQAEAGRALAASLAAVAEQTAAARQAATAELQRVRHEVSETERHLGEAKTQIVITEDIALLQEAGVYDYRHPLTDAIAYQAELGRLREQTKIMTRKDGGAVEGTTNWTVNGSVAQGRAMVRDFSKLMLRAYNAEADNLVRGLKPYRLDGAIERLTKVVATIERLGKTMDIRIAPPYHQLRVRELELTADYLAKVAEEKEREREERERLREERRAQQEIARERERLQKEHDHYLNAIAALADRDDAEGLRRLEAELEEITRAIEHIDYRAANIRAGYVYVISNLGSFGDRVVKIGMTRRLEPLDRVRELGDASVPFRYDVHALFFSDDAVGIESELHHRFTARRVNRVNPRREFFYATPQEVKAELIELAGELLRYDELPEALEFRQSLVERGSAPIVGSAQPTTIGTISVEG